MNEIKEYTNKIFEDIKHIDEVGKEIRNSIKRLGGVMPEDLPPPDRCLKELEKDK